MTKRGLALLCPIGASLSTSPYVILAGAAVSAAVTSLLVSRH